MQGQENRNYDEQRQIDRNSREIDRLRREQGEY